MPDLDVVKKYYHELDDAGRQEMRYYTHRRLDIYLAAFVCMGIASAICGAVYLEEGRWSALILSMIGGQAAARAWKKLILYHGILRYMRRFEEG